MLEHHLDEERELFPAVLASAAKGEAWLHVQAMVKQLTAEHRGLESLWKRLESGLKKVARGQDSDLDASLIDALVAPYRSHAPYEESAFLPLSQTILGRDANHRAALGMSPHIRHAKVPVSAYV